MICLLVGLLLLGLRRIVPVDPRGRARSVCRAPVRPVGHLRQAGHQRICTSGIAEAAGDWRTWALLGFGFVAFVIQQMSLATGQLAPAMATLSVANPVVSVVLGILLFDERLTRPEWHVVVAFAALLAALAGAALITFANRETEMPGEAGPHDVPADRADA